MAAFEEHILIIEDDLQTRRIIKSSLSAQGWSTVEAATAADGLKSFRIEHPHLVILDLGLPDMDGVAVVRAIRRHSDIPILILSARTLEQDKINALDAGADDYLTKPFGTGELQARIRALLRRRSGRLNEQRVFEIGNLKIDLISRQILREGVEVRLTPIEFNLLLILVRNAGMVVTHRQLLLQIWGPDHAEDVHYLRIYMGQLRHKLEADPARPRYLITEVGVGYRLMSFEATG